MFRTFVFDVFLFPRDTRPRARERFDDCLDSFLAALLKNDQICGDAIFEWTGRGVRVTCDCPRPDSLNTRYLSNWGRREFDTLASQCRARPKYRMVTRPARSHRYPAWERAGALYFFTHFLTDLPAIRSGRDGSPVPMYLLPIPDSSKNHPEAPKEYIFSWASGYRAVDQLWIGSGALEMAAYRQLANPNSKLSKAGRELSAEVERFTGLPTYYYLQRYYGRRKGERQRRCPDCGGRWARRRTAKAFVGLGGFDFRCDPCRLISCVAPDDTHEQHARIGEYRLTTSPGRLTKRRPRRPSA